MKDFTFYGGDFWSYAETCTAIKKFGVQPEPNPAEHMKQRVQEIIDRCLTRYRPAAGELELKGIFLYREQDQPGDLKQTFGHTQDIDNGQAIIGLSYGLFQYDMPVFHDLVFLHECCHLAEMDHGEEFQNRFNEVEFDYYFYHDIHMDGKEARAKPNRKGWTM